LSQFLSPAVEPSLAGQPQPYQNQCFCGEYLQTPGLHEFEFDQGYVFDEEIVTPRSSDSRQAASTGGHRGLAGNGMVHAAQAARRSLSPAAVSRLVIIAGSGHLGSVSQVSLQNRDVTYEVAELNPPKRKDADCHSVLAFEKIRTS
jgi:hypothetical protein